MSRDIFIGKRCMVYLEKDYSIFRCLKNIDAICIGVHGIAATPECTYNIHTLYAGY